MTRELLFRGKRKDNGKWVEGSLIKSGDGDCFIYPTGCRLHKTGITLYEFICNPIYEVIPETVGQFTGLLDKNGKKIWENDRVAVFFGGEVLTGIIKFVDGGFYIVFDLGRANNWPVCEEICKTVEVLEAK